MVRPLRAARGMVLLLPFVLAACTGGTGGAGYPRPPIYTPPSPSPSPQVMTGTQLKALLATGAPKGFTVDPTIDASTGDQLRDASAGPGGSPSGCAMLARTTFVEMAGVLGVSSAQRGYLTRNRAARVAERIDVFAGVQASVVMQRLARALRGCNAYPVPDRGQTTSEHLVTSMAPTLGLDAVKAETAASGSRGRAVLVAARYGTAVVTVQWITTGPDPSAVDSALGLTAGILHTIAGAQQ